MKIPTIGVEVLSEGFYSNKNDSKSETTKIVNPIMNATFPTLALALSTAASPTDNNVLQSVTGTGTWLQMSLPTINHVYPHGSSIIDNRNEHQSLVDLRLFATSTSEPAPFAITDIMLTQPDSVNLTFNSEPGKLDEVLSGSDLSAINQSEGTVAANAARTRFTRTAALTHPVFFRVAHSKAFKGTEKLPNFPLATPVKAGSLSL